MGRMTLSYTGKRFPNTNPKYRNSRNKEIFVNVHFTHRSRIWDERLFWGIVFHNKLKLAQVAGKKKAAYRFNLFIWTSLPDKGRLQLVC